MQYKFGRLVVVAIIPLKVGLPVKKTALSHDQIAAFNMAMDTLSLCQQSAVFLSKAKLVAGYPDGIGFESSESRERFGVPWFCGIVGL